MMRSAGFITSTPAYYQAHAVSVQSAGVSAECWCRRLSWCRGLSCLVIVIYRAF